MKLEWAPGEHVEVTFTPAEDEAAPLLVVWPAFGTPARFYRHLAPALAAAGLANVVVEYPGRETPRGVGRHSSYGYDALATKVHEAVMTYAHRERPEAPVYILGHSLGAHIALFAAAMHAGDDATRAGFSPRGLALVATGSPYWRGFERNGFLRSYLGTGFMAFVARTVGYWPGDRLKFWGRQSGVLVADWARLARTGHVRPKGAERSYDDALAAYTGDVLAISLPEDPLAPVTALEELLKLVPRARVTRRHAAIRVGHIQWVRRHEEIVGLTAEWVHTQEAEQSPNARATTGVDAQA